MPDLSNLGDLAASRYAPLIASACAAYKRKHNLDNAGLAVLLGCSKEDFTRLRLCSLPRSDHFQEDVQRIAEYVHVDAVKLADILAHVDEV